jgi:RNA polymerase sigma factor (sigma-70 family)
MKNASSSEDRSMLGNAVPSLLQHVRRLAATESSDEQLLTEFLARRSNEAFSVLIGRHGPMVLNVCRRILHDAHAAEDVFQATFLVLADRAGAIHRRASLAGFLHGVAYRLAVRARRRRLQSLPAAVCDRAVEPPEELAWKEMLGILDHELAQLSERYRTPLVLCHLQGRTQDEAARQLGWSLNMLRRRLAQGRRLLEARLRGRGVTLEAALAGVLAAGAVAVPGPLRAATLAAAGTPAVGSWTAGASTLSSARKGITLLLFTSGKKVGALAAMAALSAAACLAYCWAPHADHAQATNETPPQVVVPAAGAVPDDPAADPLPPQGAVRLGTARYRHGSRIESLAVSADGRLAAVASGWRSFVPARVFDLTDGRCLYSLLQEKGKGTEAVGLSADGKTLAVKDGKFLSFRNAATGKELRKLKYLPDSGGSRSVTDWLTFTPDGKQVAATLMGDAVCLIDVATGTVTRTFAPGAAASACIFSPDGKLMATGGYEKEDGLYLARLWEVGTGKELRRFPAGSLPGGNGRKRALAFSPDGATLAGGGWGDARLRLWEVATGRELKVFPKIAEDVVSVAFAPNGKTVAAAGDRIYFYDPVTGKERLRIDRRARGLAFSPDGSELIGAVSGAIYRWDAATGRPLTPTGAQDSGVEQILAAADGRHLFTIDQDDNLYAWDTTGGKPPRRIVGDVGRGAVASPDGRFLAWTVNGMHGGSRIRLYDIAAGRFIDHFPTFPEDASAEAVLPDGKTVVTLDRAASTVRFWDVGSGKELRSFPAYPARERPFRTLGDPYAYRRTALSPDGKTLVIGDMDRGLPVGLWDVATGKAGHELDVRLTSVHAAAQKAHRIDMWGPVNGYMSSGNGLTFSPDGRLVVTWSESPFESSPTDHVAVWDAATGRAVTKLVSGRPIGAGGAAFAPDGRTLATASVDGLIRLWEVATWTVRAEFRGHRDRITALAFGPAGRLFTGGLDTVVLGWDVRPPRDAARGTLAEAWEALTNADGKAAFQAQGRFLAEPGKAVEWIAARVSPVHLPDAARIKALIADLDSIDFATRERAMADLAECGPVTAAALREVVAKSSSAEARRRAEGLLREMASGIIPPRELRALRAVEVLEWIASQPTRARLLELAKGAADARLTREAAAACKRLEGRK